MLQGLDHFTLRTEDLARTRAFYTEVLGLARGPRPPFPVAGDWLYGAGRPLVHLLETTASRRAGQIDHVALQARGRAAFEHTLAERNVPYRLHALPDGSAMQLFLHDPDGVLLEVMFAAREDC